MQYINMLSEPAIPHGMHILSIWDGRADFRNRAAYPEERCKTGTMRKKIDRTSTIVF